MEMRPLILFLVGLLVFGAFDISSAAGRPRRRSRRWDLLHGKPKPAPKKPARRGVQKKEIKPAWRIRRLAPGRWRGPVGRSLEDVLEGYGQGVEGYSVADPPVAVIVWDDVAVHGHIGEALFHHLVNEAQFKFSKPFWDLVPLQFGRMRIKAGYRGFKDEPRKVWKNNPDYRMYRKAFLKCYQDYCREFGKTRCRRWLTTLLIDWQERDLLRTSRRVIAEELRRPITVEKIEEVPADPTPVYWRVGLRKIPEMQDLFAKLKAKGIDVWILSSSNNWSVGEFSREYGVHRSRVLAARVKVDDEALSAQALIPMPEGAGKPEAVALFIGRSPQLIIGGEGDRELLRYGYGARIQLVDKERLRRRRGTLRWQLQGEFSPVRESQRRTASF
jgi:phosphoglycolate phosphatase-like HAD superfamily hydrolase